MQDERRQVNECIYYLVSERFGGIFKNYPHAVVHFGRGGIELRKYLGVLIAVAVFAGLIEAYNLRFFVYAGVTNQPLPQSQIEQLQNQGFQVQPLKRRNGEHLVSELYVARLTAPIMKTDRGNRRNIDLVKVSGDKWKNTPCYLVTIQPVVLELYTGGGKTGSGPPSGLEIFVDAKTGKIITQMWLQ